MKSICLLSAILFLFSCNQPNSDGSNAVKTDTIKKKPVAPELICSSIMAEHAVKEYLLNTGMIQYSGQMSVKESTKLNDNCDFKVTVQFYLKDLIDGDGYKIYRVGYDGAKYFVY